MSKLETGMKRSGGHNWFAPLAVACLTLAVGAASAQQPASSDQQSVQIKSEKLEGLRDEGRYIYTGNVEVVDGKSRLISDKLTLICDQPATPAPKKKGESASPTCQIKQLVAESNVYYFLDTDKVHGERAEYDYANRIITVTGTPTTPVVLSRADKGVISGPKLVYDTNKGVARMSGVTAGDRVTSIFEPKDNNTSSPPSPGAPTAPAPSLSSPPAAALPAPH